MFLDGMSAAVSCLFLQWVSVSCSSQMSLNEMCVVIFCFLCYGSVSGSLPSWMSLGAMPAALFTLLYAGMSVSGSSPSWISLDGMYAALCTLLFDGMSVSASSSSWMTADGMSVAVSCLVKGCQSLVLLLLMYPDGMCAAVSCLVMGCQRLALLPLGCL